MKMMKKHTLKIPDKFFFLIGIATVGEINRPEIHQIHTSHHLSLFRLEMGSSNDNNNNTNTFTLCNWDCSAVIFIKKKVHEKKEKTLQQSKRQWISNASDLLQGRTSTVGVKENESADSHTEARAFSFSTPTPPLLALTHKHERTQERLVSPSIGTRRQEKKGAPEMKKSTKLLRLFFES
jgi:hypothetical protein